MSPTDPRLDALQRYADGLATRDDLALIERAIIEDAAFRDLALDYLHLDSAMEEFATCADSVPLPTPARRSRWIMAVAAAAAVIVFGILLRYVLSETPLVATPAKTPIVKPPDAPPERIEANVEVEVLQLVNATFESPNAGLKVRDRVRLDTLKLIGGDVRLSLPSQVMLSVSGPAELRFVDALHVRMSLGKATVDCDGNGQGFRIDTLTAQIINVSTRLGVQAHGNGSTDVLVLSGTADVVLSQKSQRLLSLKQSEAVRIDAAQSFSRIATMTSDANLDTWSTQPPADACIVALNDNLGSTNDLHFYRIVPRGLKPGGSVYTNRGDTWQAANGQAFPASLADADAVQTFWSERRPANIDITLARPAEVFVLLSRRRPPPAWVTEAFNRTGEQLELEEPGQGTRAPSHVPYEVWKRTVSRAEKITLGPGDRQPNAGSTGLFGIGIAVKVLEP